MRSMPDTLTVALMPLVCAVLLCLLVLGAIANVFRLAALGLDWLGDVVEDLLADDAEGSS